MRDWTFKIDVFPVEMGEYIIEAEDNLNLFGAFLIPPANDHLAVLFTQRGQSDDEKAAHEAQKELVAKVTEAAEHYGLPLHQMTDELYNSYVALKESVVEGVAEEMNDDLIDFEERAAALKGWLEDEQRDSDEDDDG